MCVFLWVNQNNRWVTVILLFRWIMGAVQKFRCITTECKQIQRSHGAFFKVYLLVVVIYNTHDVRHDTTPKNVGLHMYIVFIWGLFSLNIDIWLSAIDILFYYYFYCLWGPFAYFLRWGAFAFYFILCKPFFTLLVGFEPQSGKSSYVMCMCNTLCATALT